MIKEAILNLKERNGSSRQAIKKYIQANNNLGATTDAQFSNHISKALQVGEDAGVFSRPKGPSGPVKLAKKDAKPAASKTSPPAKPAAKKEKEAPAKAAPAKVRCCRPNMISSCVDASSQKSTSTKAAPKKAAPEKKATASKAAPKKKADTAKPKANAGRPRKTAAPAPAVEDKPAVVLGKTKSGRVTKSRQPAAVAKPTRKAAAATKKTSAKKATPKKATPKKASA
ncbi:hypothetical protein W97_08218 [Coniosporium apollinis CBS 100218]|uniref:Histone H1 n=1 Tax=Coniosporium apollinis (strain CBS 100218) TaxID=1168221 RepID=R7Z445_CONA1|nr:uncharacterized protein W97_08218 [Coniosporium apollinis CBS 100218]EON68960.1 hypothetical protein W97_08218 [Coniosporium apollinis CBS 100218]